jgi:hypothetical protein
VSEEQKVNSLLNKITDPTMEVAKEALIMKRYDKPKTVTFAWAANHLATKVKSTPQKDLRNISSVNKSENKMRVRVAVEVEVGVAMAGDMAEEIEMVEEVVILVGDLENPRQVTTSLMTGKS